MVDITKFESLEQSQAKILVDRAIADGWSNILCRIYSDGKFKVRNIIGTHPSGSIWFLLQWYGETDELSSQIKDTAKAIPKT